jgi:hypothetical protein
MAVLELRRLRTPFLATRAFTPQDGYPRGISQKNWILLAGLYLVLYSSFTVAIIASAGTVMAHLESSERLFHKAGLHTDFIHSVVCLTTGP